MKRATILIILLLLPLSYSQEVGIGASPAKVDVILGNETDIPNTIQYSFTIYNTGDVTITTRVEVEEEIKEFVEIPTQILTIYPNSTDKLEVYFVRDGFSEKKTSGLIIVNGIWEKTNPSMVSTNPAVAIKVNLHQLEMKDTRLLMYRITLILLILGLILFVVLIYYKLYKMSGIKK
jgi:hypothetical protein